MEANETIGELVARRGSDQYAAKIALIIDDISFTYAEANDHTNRWANALRADGVSKGDVVATLSRSRPDLIWIWFACAKIGAVFAPMNDAFKGEFLRHPLADAGASVVVCAPELFDALDKVLPRLDGLRRVVVFDETGESTADLEPSAGNAQVVSSVAFLGGPEEVAVDAAPTDIVAIMYTGGTTGPSKGVAISHRYMLHASHVTWAARGGHSGTVVYTPLPLYHMNTPVNTVLGPYLAGATGVIDSRFSVSRFWQRVRGCHATQVCILGSMITMLWSQEEDERDRENEVEVLFGVPVPVDLHQRFEERFGLRIITLYGLTEAFPLTISSVVDPPSPGTSGKVHSAWSVRVTDADGNAVEQGQPGELVCRPNRPGVMFDGYWNNPQATLESIRDLWLRTGDMVRFEPNGDLIFLDRLTDSMRRRGENVSSYELEQAVLLHPDVVEAVAHAVPSPVTEDDIKICVELAPGATSTPEELYEHCLEEMPRYALPRYIEIFNKIPVTSVGRVRKADLRERGVTTETWDREQVRDNDEPR